MAANESRYIARFHPDFPEKLNYIPTPPPGIYVRGRLPNPGKPTVAIIGARDATPYGLSVASYFAKELSKEGIQIISGMARGIDGAAQRTAVENGEASFGVLGCGTNVIYPKENELLFERILGKGGLISEYPDDTPPIANHFPQRNRIISGLADVVLVVEAREKSGTKSTVRHALEQGKDILAIPGRIDDPLSRGCNSLIAEGAAIALSPETVLESLGIFRDEPESPKEFRMNPGKKRQNLSKLENLVLDVLDYRPKDLEQIMQSEKIRRGMDRAILLEILLKLQIMGLIGETGKQHYNLI